MTGGVAKKMVQDSSQNNESTTAFLEIFEKLDKSFSRLEKNIDAAINAKKYSAITSDNASDTLADTAMIERINTLESDNMALKNTLSSTIDKLQTYIDFIDNKGR